MRVEPIRNRADIERVERVLKYYSYRDWMVFKVGINTALRVGDLLKLKVWQVKATHLNLHESKTRKLKRFYINDSMRPLLEDYIKYMDDADFLFRPIRKNAQPSTGAVYRTIRDAARLCGLSQIGTHSMRKTFGYHFYRETGDIALLMELLNHSHEKETLIYIGVIQEELDSSVKTFFL